MIEEHEQVTQPNESVLPEKCDVDAPLFVIGSPRSGTTWVQRLLVAHPRICGGQESHFFEMFADALHSLVPVKPGQRAIGLACYFTEPEFQEIVRGIWRQMMQPIADAKPTATLLMEKTPEHSLFVPMALTLFPRARFIHVIRDSRGVVASLLAAGRAEWGRSWAPKRAKAAAIKWFRCVRAARENGRPLGPDRYTEVYYEDLLANPIEQTTRLYNFLKLDASPELVQQIVDENQLDAQKKKGGTPFVQAGENAKVAHSAKEPVGFFNAGKADGWKQTLSLTQKLVTWRYTRKMMRSCGYNWDGTRSV